jgi:hypothetical protein
VLFAPALPDLESVRAVCAALKKPLNFMAGIPGKSFSVAALEGAGVKRISLATSLYRAAMKAAREGRDRGPQLRQLRLHRPLVIRAAGRDRMRAALSPGPASGSRPSRSCRGTRGRQGPARIDPDGVRRRRFGEAAARRREPASTLALGWRCSASGSVPAAPSPRAEAAAGSSVSARSSAWRACSAAASRSARPAGRSPG